MIYLRDKKLLLITKAVWKLNFWKFSFWNKSFKIKIFLNIFFEIKLLYQLFLPGAEKLYNITQAVDKPRTSQESISWLNDFKYPARDKRKTKPTKLTQTKCNQNQQTRTKHNQNWTKTEGCTKKNISKNCSKNMLMMKGQNEWSIYLLRLGVHLHVIKMAKTQK